jgi:hypothetical protein
MVEFIEGRSLSQSLLNRDCQRAGRSFSEFRQPCAAIRMTLDQLALAERDRYPT